MDSEKVKNWLHLSVNDLLNDPGARRELAKMLIQYCAARQQGKSVEDAEKEFADLLSHLTN